MKKHFTEAVVLFIIMMLCACVRDEGEPVNDDLTVTEPDKPDTTVLLPSVSAISETSRFVYSSERIDYIEPYASSFSDYLDVTTVDGVTFCFEKLISQADREACIDSTQQILGCIGAEKELKIVVYRAKTFDTTYISDGTVYTHVQDWNTDEYFETVLSGFYGAFVNHGLIHGYAEHLFDRSKTDVEAAGPDWDAAEKSEVLDLNRLCFDDRFVPSKDVEIAEQTARAFVSDYIDRHGENAFSELLLKSGDPEQVDEYVNALREFYLSHGIDYTPSAILYACGGHSFDYVARCKCASFYVRKDWHDALSDINPLVSEDFLHTDYREVRDFFEINSEQMEKYCELFGFGAEDEEVKVLFTPAKNSSSTSYYQENTRTIFLTAVSSLQHEYIHVITLPRIAKQRLWNTEGLATCYAYRYNRYMFPMLNVDYNSAADNNSPEFLRTARDWLGRAIDMETDHRLIDDLVVYSRHNTSPDDSYIAGSSLVAWIVEQLGDSRAIELICSENGIPAQQYEEYVRGWLEHVSEVGDKVYKLLP